ADRDHPLAHHLGLQGVRPRLPPNRRRPDRGHPDLAAPRLQAGLRHECHGPGLDLRDRHHADAPRLHGALSAPHARGGRSLMRREPPLGRVLTSLMVWPVVLLVIFPLIWMMLTSVKPQAELFRIPATFWPQSITFEHYWTLIANTPFLKYLRNSITLSV